MSFYLYRVLMKLLSIMQPVIKSGFERKILRKIFDLCTLATANIADDGTMSCMRFTTT